MYLTKEDFNKLPKTLCRAYCNNHVNIDKLPEINFLYFTIDVDFERPMQFMECSIRFETKSDDIIRSFCTGMFAGDGTYWYDVTEENIRKVIIDELCVSFIMQLYPTVRYNDSKLAIHAQKVYDHYKDQIDALSKAIVDKYNKFLEMECLV